MKLIIKLLGIFIVIVGVTLLIKPQFVLGWIEDYMGTRSLYIFAIVMRLFFGILLIIAAKKSMFPGVIKFFGYLALIAAVIFIFIGEERFLEFVSSALPYIKDYAVLVGLVAAGLGGFLVYAFIGNKKLKH